MISRRPIFSQDRASEAEGDQECTTITGASGKSMSWRNAPICFLQTLVGLKSGWPPGRSLSGTTDLLLIATNCILDEVTRPRPQCEGLLHRH
jgi:hypothetical protein